MIYDCTFHHPILDQLHPQAKPHSVDGNCRSNKHNKFNVADEMINAMAIYAIDGNQNSTSIRDGHGLSFPHLARVNTDVRQGLR